MLRNPQALVPQAFLSFALALGAFSGSAFGLDRAAAEAFAVSVLAESGRQKGILCLPRSQPELGGAFARKSGLLVYNLAANEAAAEGLAQTGRDLKALGRTFYVDRAAGIPFADNYLDLLVMADVKDADLKAAGAVPGAAEIARALLPGGRAYVGCLKSEGAVSEAALRAFAEGAGGKVGVSVKSDAAGLFIVMTKKPLEGSDDWGHRLHNPGNNPLSNDRLIAPPYLPQTRFKPYNIDRYGSAVAANGRLYTAVNDGGYWGSNPRLPHYLRYLRAFRLHNGQLLWTRELHADFPEPKKDEENMALVSSSNYIAKGDELYFAKKDSVLILDGETGRTRGFIRFPEAPGNIRWMGLEGNVLNVLVGDTGVYGRSGQRVAGYDLAQKRVLWTQAAGGEVDLRFIGLADRKLSFYAENKRLASLDAVSGATLWSNTEPRLFKMLEKKGGYQSWTLAFLSGFLCTKDGVFIGGHDQDTLVALAPQDGRILWLHGRDGGRGLHKVLKDQSLFTGRVQGKYPVLDIRTGKGDSSFKAWGYGAGCGPLSATPLGLYGQAGGITFDFGRNRSVTGRSYKGPCDMPTLLTGGTAITLSAPCGCPDLHRGNLVDAPAGAYPFEALSNAPERLEAGPGLGQAAAVPTDTNDWYTHRGNAMRSASSRAAVAAAPRLIYHAKGPQPLPVDLVDNRFNVDASHFPTPAVTAGKLTVWATSDGQILCFDAAQGRFRWVQQVGGAVVATPHLAGGRVYAGSLDGHAYAFDLATGKRLWRFRAAPVDRRINLYGFVASTWPVVTGVLVHQGLAYFGAGLMDEYGSSVYGVDAETGRLVWQNQQAAVYLNKEDRKGFTPAGQMIVIGGKLWVRSYYGRDGIFDLRTGALDSLPASLAGRSGGPTARGQEIGLLDKDRVVFGGRLALSEPNEGEHHVRGIHFRFLKLSAGGTPTYPQLEPAERAGLTPAWDGEGYYSSYVGGGNRTYFEKWDQGWLVRNLDSAFAANTKDPKDWPWWSSYHVPMKDIWDTTVFSMTRWRKGEMNAMAVAVARNALILLHGKDPKGGQPREKWDWFVSTVSKTDGRTLWEEKLPSQPIYQGLAVNRDGDILVSLRDGSIAAYGGGAVVSVQAPAAKEKAARTTARALAFQALKAARLQGSLGSRRAAATAPKMAGGNSSTASTASSAEAPAAPVAAASGAMTLKALPAPRTLAQAPAARGHIVPSRDGEYPLFLAGEGPAEFALAYDENPRHAVVIAALPDGAAREVKSLTVRLRAGRRYYFEVRPKEALEAGRVRLEWREEDGETAPVPVEPLP